MKIVAICGSPRKGNTEFILKRILTQAEKSEVTASLVLLRNQRIEFCDGCLTCDSSFICHKKDDMQMIYSRLEDADLIILGSPTYFDNVTGMMKNCIDRLEPISCQGKLKEKKVAFVTVGQDNKKSIDNTIKYFENFADITSMIAVGDLSFIAIGDQDVENNQEYIAKIDEFVNNLMN